MRSQRSWVAAAVALVVLIGAGVVLVLHAPASAEPGARPSAAGPPPSEARKAVGRPPRVDSPKAGAPPSVLGTVFILRGSGKQLEVQPTAVDAGGEPSSPQQRRIRVQVSFLAVTGSAAAIESDFVLVDQNGTRYRSRSWWAYGDVLPLGTSTLRPGGRASGAVFFEVPTTASSLLLAYLPAPSKAVAGRWLLAAP